MTMGSFLRGLKMDGRLVDGKTIFVYISYNYMNNIAGLFEQSEMMIVS